MMNTMKLCQYKFSLSDLQKNHENFSQKSTIFSGFSGKKQKILKSEISNSKKKKVKNENRKTLLKK